VGQVWGNLQADEAVAGIVGGAGQHVQVAPAAFLVKTQCPE
jgi:uncharacterized spore protein YtfJ